MQHTHKLRETKFKIGRDFSIISVKYITAYYPLRLGYYGSFTLFFSLQGIDGDAMNESLEDNTLGIYVVKEHVSSDQPEDISIILEGSRLLKILIM